MNNNQPSSTADSLEWQTRIDLAALYRLVALHGWDDLIFTHITAHIPGSDKQFLINPYGLMFDEVTASNLVKIDIAGNIMGETLHQINPAGYNIHSAVHEVRPDAQCVIHLHTKAGVAVSAQTNGLLPISQQASIALTSLAYHDFEGIALSVDERTRLQSDLGNSTNLILRNHGLLTIGSSIAQAFLSMYMLESACQIQVMAQSGGAELVLFDQEIIDKTDQLVDQVTQGEGGTLAWPALLRKLDRIDPTYRN